MTGASRCAMRPARPKSALGSARKVELMDYKAAIHDALEQVREEGRYRVFADLKRHRGDFPMATWTPPAEPRAQGRAPAPRDVVVWCSNDYLGQGQNPVVIAAMHQAIDEAGAGSGGTRNI